MTTLTKIRSVRSAVFRKINALRYIAYTALAAPLLLASHASAANSVTTVASQGFSGTPTIFLTGYLGDFPMAGSSLHGTGNIIYDTLARNVMIGILLAICIAMFVGASFLWRENINKIRSDAETRNRNRINDYKGGL